MEYVCHENCTYHLLHLLLKLNILKGQANWGGVITLIHKDSHNTIYFMPPEDQL